MAGTRAPTIDREQIEEAGGRRGLRTMSRIEAALVHADLANACRLVGADTLNNMGSRTALAEFELSGRLSRRG